MDTQTMILVVAPLIVLQLGLMIWALLDLRQRGGTRGPLPVWVWIVIIVLGELLGPVLYFLFGRKEAY